MTRQDDNGACKHAPYKAPVGCVLARTVFGRIPC
jgi:hypothetical protein